MRLLIVEDEAEIQRFLERALTEASFDVDVAGSARAAMKCVAKPNYGIIFVVDLGLPDQGGIRLDSFLSSRRSRGAGPYSVSPALG